MIAPAVIAFREILEIALILSVVIAATEGVAHRGKWILFGIIGGILGSLVVAFFAGAITKSMQGLGQEILNASILAAATILIGWTIVWMRKHGREITQKMQQVGTAVKMGEVPMYMVSVVIALTVLREGSEMVLFTYGLIAAGTGAFALVSGVIFGAIGGIAVGVLFYLGLIKLSTRYIFAVTTWLLALLASGLAAQAAGYLTQAGLIPSLLYPVWDSSHLLSEKSIFGQVLHTLIGYNDRPSAMQLVFYGGTFATIATAVGLTHQEPAKTR